MLTILLKTQPKETARKLEWPCLRQTPFVEFKAHTGNYDATYGRGTGANVDVISRTGMDHIHGTGMGVRERRLQCEQFLFQTHWSASPCAQAESVRRHRGWSDPARGHFLLWRVPGIAFEQWRRRRGNCDFAATDEQSFSGHARRGILRLPNLRRRHATSLRWIEHQSGRAETAELQIAQRTVCHSQPAD